MSVASNLLQQREPRHDTTALLPIRFAATAPSAQQREHPDLDRTARRPTIVGPRLGIGTPASPLVRTPHCSTAAATRTQASALAPPPSPSTRFASTAQATLYTLGVLNSGWCRSIHDVACELRQAARQRRRHAYKRHGAGTFEPTINRRSNGSSASRLPTSAGFRVVEFWR